MGEGSTFPFLFGSYDGLMTELSAILSEAYESIRAAENLQALDAVRVRMLGKKGVFAAQMKTLACLSPAERPAFGQIVNVAKQAVIDAIETRRAELDAARLAAELAGERIDV